MPEKQFLDYEGLQRYHSKLKLSTNTGESSAQTKIGDIIFPARDDTFSQIPENYIPAAGQILYAADYPELAEAIGPMPAGYTISNQMDSVSIPNLHNIHDVFQSKTGRVILASHESSGWFLYYSDDNFLTFQRTAPVDGGIYKICQSKIEDRLVALATRYVYFSYDDGTTWEGYAHETMPGVRGQICQTESGRIYTATAYNERKCSDDDGLTWTTLPSIGSYGGWSSVKNIACSNETIITLYRYGSSNFTIGLLTSKDNGVTYSYHIKLSNTVAYNTASISLFDNNIILASGYGAGTYISTDLGVHFSKMSDIVIGDFDQTIVTGPRSLYYVGSITNDYGHSSFPTEIVQKSATPLICLQNGTLITTYSNSLYFLKGNAALFRIPEISGGYIRYK